MGMVDVIKSPLMIFEMSKNKPEYEIESKEFDSIISDATKKSAGKGHISESVANELIKSRDDMDQKSDNYQKTVSKGFVTISLSDRTITAPNIPIIRDIIFKIKTKKINAQIEKTKETLRMEEEKTDSTVKAAVSTNSFTNPNGKGVVKTKAAIKGDTSNPREQGGEIRTRKGR